MINIKLTTRKNNFFLTASNEKKNLIFQSTGGQEKFKGKQKKTDTAFAAALFKLFLKITKQKKNGAISFITKGFMA
jgi:ribosomal protein S11